jgi:hypothetical protein
MGETLNGPQDAQAEAMAALDALGPADATAETDRPPAKRSHQRKTGRPPKPSRAARPPRASAPRRPSIADGMARLYTLAGVGVSAVPSRLAVAGPDAGKTPITGVTGAAMVSNSKQLGAAWEAAAREDPRIREALEKILTVSTLGQIVAAHLPIFLLTACAAGAVPAEVLVAMGIMDEVAGEAAKVYDFPTPTPDVGEIIDPAPAGPTAVP